MAKADPAERSSAFGSTSDLEAAAKAESETVRDEALAREHSTDLGEKRLNEVLRKVGCQEQAQK